MHPFTWVVVLTVLGVAFAVTTWALKPLLSCLPWRSQENSPKKIKNRKIQEIKALTNCHEVAAKFAELFHTDGAGSWPPNVNHDTTTWPPALRPYRDIYLQMAPLLPQPVACLDDEVNKARVANFRAQYRKLLQDRIDMTEVKALLEAANAGRWDVFPRETYNAFYCCIASARHAYRWATVPVVKVVQLERVLDIPAELDVPWAHMQRNFGCASQSGNNTSCLMINFDNKGEQVYKINTGLEPHVLAAEDTFVRMFHDIEVLAVPIYHEMLHAIVAFARNDKVACAKHMAGVTAALRPILGNYYNNLHDQKIPLKVWLSHVQGFFAWNAGYVDPETNEHVIYDGISGNQILVFQCLDAFLGYDAYLSKLDQDRNLPARQRALVRALEKHSFRKFLHEAPQDEAEEQIQKEFAEIVRRLRTFRSAHRVRSKNYLSQPTPERLPMMAGKSLMAAPTMKQSFQFLDDFMVTRLNQTI
ncbi:hypothetical protein S40293_10482 [Stachybotrys chartarum IBT 40293]|nr:hypothetical protein S40293_10482 [Stachybotrys chartarum IBT 40293]